MIEQNQDYRKFWQNSGSPKILTKFDITSEIFDKNRYLRKSWLKSRFFENFDQCQDFQRILTEINIFRTFWTFLKILTEIKNLCILTKMKIFKNFDKIEIMYNNFSQNSIIWKVWAKSRFFNDKRRIPRILTEIKIFHNFYQNWDFPKI